MRNRLKALVLATAVAGSTLFGMTCMMDARDAVFTRVLDYITGTTTDLLTGTMSADTILGAG